MSAPARRPRDPRERIVVTGIGAVCGLGTGVAALWAGLLAGRTAVRPLRRFSADGHRTTLAAEVPANDLGTTADPTLRGRLSLADHFALTAAAEAVAQAGLDPLPRGARSAAAGGSEPAAAPGGPLAGAGVFFGSSTGGMWESEAYYARLLGHAAGRPRLERLVSQQYNGPGDAVARWAGVHGPVVTVSSACTSGAVAIAAAADALRGGELELALAGAADSLCQLTYAGFNALRAVDPAPCRPFRAERAGMSLGEGAAVLVLETVEHARRRGATPLAELLAATSGCDAHHMTAPAPDGRGAAAAIRRALAEAELPAAAVGFVNAHGTGTPLNDLAEWQALLAGLGPDAAALPLTAPKGSVGHLLGAAGALEAVATILCLLHRQVHPTPAGGSPDPQAPARLVQGAAPGLADGAVGLSLNLAFGGSNAALLLRCWPEGA